MPRSPSKPRSENRVRAERQGHRAETLAALLLRAKLYRIRDRRFRTPLGEIDIVAERGNWIVFVEVKQRGPRATETEALQAVDRQRIARAAQMWLVRHPEAQGRNFRFDVIFLAPGRWPRHLINAFPAL